MRKYDYGLLSCFSYVQLFGTLGTVAHQAPLSMGFSSLEHWSGLPLPSPAGMAHTKTNKQKKKTKNTELYILSGDLFGPLFNFSALSNNKCCICFETFYAPQKIKPKVYKMIQKF